MNLITYPVSTNETFLDYEFESEGPNGKFKKVVRYSPQNAEGMTYFNLGFGDWDDANGKINDTVITNNDDRDLVLSTVASTVLDFTSHFPDIPVYAQGSSPSRTRLYQMGISAHWAEIEPILNVWGLHKQNWELFRKGVNYEAFFAKRK